MADNDKPQRVSIGFNGGQVLSARVAPDELSKLRGALGTDGWYDLTAEDGTVYPFHCTQIGDGTRTIAVGTKVEFELMPRLGEP